MNMRKIIRMFFLSSSFALCIEAGEQLVANGQTVAEVIRILGEPNGTVAKGKDSYLYYNGLIIKVTGGIVTDLPANFNAALKSAQKTMLERDTFVQEQKSKCLVCYKNEWLTKSEAETRQKADEMEARAKQQLAVDKQRQDAEIQKLKDQFGIGKENRYGPTSEFQIYRGDGSLVDHRPLAVPGKVVLIAITRNNAICPIFWKELESIARSDSDVVLQRVDFSSWDDPVAQQLGISRTNPLTRVVDPEGRNTIAYGYCFDPKKLREAIEQAKQQCGIGKKISSIN